MPWGDPSKGFQTIVDKRNAMVVKYMQKTGCSKEEAETEVDEYLKDKEGYIKRKRAVRSSNGRSRSSSNGGGNSDGSKSSRKSSSSRW